MTTTLGDLLRLIDLERVEFNIYRGENRNIGTGRVFGGQVLAQALVAARRTVEEDRPVHSAHGYFILPGDLKVPIVYLVERLRDGKSFTTRRVTAIQHGRAIFNLAVSFHSGEPGIEHQVKAPDAPPPETIVPELDRLRAPHHGTSAARTRPALPRASDRLARSRTLVPSPVPGGPVAPVRDRQPHGRGIEGLHPREYLHPRGSAGSLLGSGGAHPGLA
jgi:acyl-CoA thioesterase